MCGLTFQLISWVKPESIWSYKDINPFSNNVLVVCVAADSCTSPIYGTCCAF